jgi:hypothetical protein
LLHEKSVGANPINPANAAFAAGIVSARSVYDNAAATEDQIQEAILALRNQLSLFKNAYEEQSSLKAAIAAADKLLEDNTQYLNRLSVRAAAAVFKGAIQRAESVLSDPKASLVQLTAANAALVTEVSVFEKALDDALVNLKLLGPWYNKYPLPSKVNLNSANSMTIQTDSGDFYQISTTDPATKQMQNLHLIDIPNAENLEITTELTFSPTANYQTAGIIFYLDDYNTTSIVRRYHNGGSPSNCYMSQRNNGISGTTASSGEQRFTDYAVSTAKCYLRLIKNGATITGYYSEDNVNWRQAYAYTQDNINAASTISVGLFAANGTGVSPASIPATFENFKIGGVLQSFTKDLIVGINDTIVRTPLGTSPVLPDVVTAVSTNGSTEEYDVVWDAISPDKYAAPGVFDVEGSVEKANMIAVAHVTVFPTSIEILPGNNKATAKFTVVADGKSVKYSEILSLYDRSGKLVDTVIKPGSLNAGEWTQESLEISQPRGYTVKAFIWDAVTYVPLLASVSYEEPWVVDKSALLDVINAAEALDMDAYSRLSADKLLSVLEEAYALYNDPDATRYLINEVIDKIDSAKGLLEFPTNVVKLSGTIYGREGTYGNSTVNTYDKLFDGNVNTFFDSNVGDSAWVGIDLGEGNETYVYSFRYHPRTGWPSRMDGCTLRGSMTVTNGNVGTLLHTVSGVSAFQYYTADSQVKDQKFRYLWIQSGSEWWGNTSELEFYGRGSEADLSLLSDRIVYADTLSAADYTSGSWATLQSALASARTLTAASTQAAVDSSAGVLKAALAQLVRA